jgi:nickel/cobalt transporter (NiCoT) family protein
METEVVSVSGLSLMFLLGLRHGFDPDHIAMIDNMAYQHLTARPRLAPWIGTLFALGHGLTVTTIAVALGSFSGVMPVSALSSALLEWLPIAMLLMVGTLNLRNLFGQRDYHATGWKTRFIPESLRTSSHPLAIVLIGVMFALVFDTATQAAAWGYAATARSGMSMALLVGLVFTIGMVITDTLDGRLMVRLLRRLSQRGEAQAYRRRIGWIVVVLSYGIAVYGIAKHLHPALELGDTMTTITGFALFFGLLIGYVWLTQRQPALSHSLIQE